MDAARVSADLFGRRCRLPLALWILEHDKRFYQSEPPREIAGQTAVRQELARFHRAGMIEMDRPDGENRVYYEKTDSPLWEIIRKARDVLANSIGAKRLVVGAASGAAGMVDQLGPRLAGGGDGGRPVAHECVGSCRLLVGVVVFPAPVWPARVPQLGLDVLSPAV